jgi:glutamine synthetase
MQDVRSEMVNHMVSIGMKVEAQHHEVATAGQQEIDLRFDTLLSHADDLQKYKYVVRNTAKSNGLSATFMPKPLSNDNGSGMHCHQSIWSNGKPIFYADSGYANLSDEAKFYIGGLLKHAPSLLAFTNPTINSFKRLVPGYEAPVKLAYSNRNRSAICRPYLAFSAMVMAGLDGIKNRIDPGEPMDKNLYDLPPEEQAKVKEVPSSLEEAVNNLEANHDYLLEGNVFTKDLIESYIEYKREEEIEPNKLLVTPKEYDLYYDY